MCESSDVCTRYALSNRLVFEIDRERWESWIGVSRVHHGERVHLRSESDELDDLISIALVLEVPYFTFVMIAVKFSRMEIRYGRKVEGAVYSARFEFLWKVVDEELEEE
jgi:hypothetical protein